MAHQILKTDILYANLLQDLAGHSTGEKFFATRELMERYKVSQLVVEQAVSRLREEGVLEVVRGRGTFIRKMVDSNAAKKPPTILFVVPRWNSGDLRLMEKSLDKLRESCDERILVYDYDYTEHVPHSLPFDDENVCGIAMLTSSALWNAQCVARLEEYAKRVPLVIMNRHCSDLDFAAIGADDILAGNMAIQHLIKHGHKRIAVLVSEPMNGTIRERIRGVCNCAHLFDVSCEILDCGIKCGDYAPDKTYRYMCELLKKKINFTGLVGVSADSFVGTVNACLNAGLAIPGDLSLVAIGDRHIAEIQHPQLDCVDLNNEQQLTSIIKVLAGRREPLTREDYFEFCRPELVIHGSVTAPCNA